ncbi:MAG: hypothetical protein GIW95_11435 [Candidatus Eremiobacteraeota bacterium]|nr:hypothetical protein [Candidatus Eremiobacteraeota bacterium]
MRAFEAACALARSHGVRVAFDDLGDWAPAVLFSEYDASARTIAVNLRIATRFRERLGETFAGDFCAAAVLHELRHATAGDGEDAAHAAVRAAGFEPSLYEATWRAVRA